MEDKKIFPARNISITNFLLNKGCTMTSVTQNKEFSSKKGGYRGTMLIFNFESNEILDEALNEWKIKKESQKEC